jgi:hypothetical protein
MLDNINDFNEFKNNTLEHLDDIVHLVNVDTDNIYEQEEIMEEVKEHLLDILETFNK